MSLRNFVPSYPQCPPPHHQTHRVQALPVSVATALQQQISQQQAAAAQQQSQQGSAQSNQNSGGSVQSAQQSHEYHIASCLPFQTPAGANLAQNFIRHMSNGGYAQTHPQSQAIYQTQGPPGVVQSQQSSQTNPGQNQQNQARLTPMSQPTAPPTPPNNQQQQQPTPPQYAVQIQQQGIPAGGGNGGNPRAPPYRSQSQVPRRQQQINQQYLYQQPISGVPYSFVLPSGHVRAPTYGFLPYQPMYNNFTPAPGYGQMTAPSNGQQRQSTPQTAVPTMAQPQANEYQYPSIDVYPQVMQAPPQVSTQAPPPQPQKTVKKTGSKAIQIINPATGKNIFEEDTSGVPATVDKATTASHNELNKDEAVEKETMTASAEPSTPVVSAMSDGPSVDITPKHQVNKIKKLKPPEIVAIPVLTTQNEQLPAKSTETESVESIPQDNENNNVTLALPTTPVVEKIPVVPEPVLVEVKVPPAATVVLDVNDNYQKVTKASNEQKEVKQPVKVPVKEVEATPQDSNNNSTDDKSVMTSPSIRQVSAPSPTPVIVEEKPVEVVEETVRKVSTVEGPIDYDFGQWSPANLDGKKYYTREQLLKLKDQPIAGAVPSMGKLPDNVVQILMKNNKDTLTTTLNQTMPLQSMSNNNMQRGVGTSFDPINNIVPKFMTTMGGGRNPYQKRPSQQGNNKQQVPGNGRGSQAGIIKLTLSLQDDVKLNEASNAWKPSHLVKKQDMTEEERVTAELLSRFRSMLNKLTADNFDLLVEQVKLYKIDTSERLDGVISLVFEKAISEPKFAPTYANLCKEVAFITTAPQGQGEKKNTLKAKLITQCQKEFERHKEESITFNDIEDKLREIEKIQEQDKREERKARLEEEHYRVRQRANGTVKFIGELYKIDMLTSKIMRACIDMLLQEATEEKIERVCKLLTTIGHKMEDQDGRNTLEKYFTQLREMLHPNHKIIKSSRIKFEIQNLEDLRNCKWKARRQDLTPKTMGQMQMEADQEQQMMNYSTRQNAKDDRQRGNQGGYNNNNNNNNNRRGQQQDSEGWLVQQNNKSRVPLQINKISIPSMGSEAKLGSPADYQKFMMPPTNTNKYSGLPVDTDTDVPQRFGGGVGSGGSKNSSMERSGDRGSRMYGNGGSDGRYSGRSSGSNQGSRNSSQIRSRDNSDGPGGPSRSLQAPRHQQVPLSGGSSMSFSGALKNPLKAAPTTTLAPTKHLTEDELAKNIKDMLEVVDAYRTDKLSLDKAIAKLSPVIINKDVLIEVYNKYLDRKASDRENLMLLLCEMLRLNKLSREENRDALIETMNMAPDMIYDVPRVYEYIAQFLAELLIASVLTFQDVDQICKAYNETKRSGEEMLRHMFIFVNDRHGAAALTKIIANADCDLNKFISDGNFKRWLEANKFTNTVRQARGVADVMKQVKQMLDEKKNTESIISHISSTADCTTDPFFIRNLTTVVIENCCDEFNQGSDKSSFKLRNARLEDLSMVLGRFIDNNPELELQCIYALQNFAFDREYPPGLLNSTFEILYDSEVLSTEAFETWQKSEGPKESQQGKGVAVASTRQFFTKLAEDKDDDDPDLYGDEVEQL